MKRCEKRNIFYYGYRTFTQRKQLMRQLFPLHPVFLSVQAFFSRTQTHIMCLFSNPAPSARFHSIHPSTICHFTISDFPHHHPPFPPPASLLLFTMLIIIPDVCSCLIKCKIAGGQTGGKMIIPRFNKAELCQIEVLHAVSHFISADLSPINAHIISLLNQLVAAVLSKPRAIIAEFAKNKTSTKLNSKQPRNSIYRN